MKEPRDPVEQATREAMGLPSNVLVLPVKPQQRAIDNPMLKIETDRTGKYPSCFAHQFSFDTDQRTVWCRDCKRHFDPFDALVEIGKQWQRYEWDRQSCERDIKKLNQERDELDRVVKNLKAQKRRVHETLAKEGRER